MRTRLPCVLVSLALSLPLLGDSPIGKDPNLDVERIGLTKDLGGLPILLKALDDPACDHDEVLLALGRLGSPQAIPAILDDFMRRSAPLHYESVEDALGMIDQEWRSRNEVLALRGSLADRLEKSTDWREQYELQSALFNMFPRQSIELARSILRKRLRSPDDCSYFDSEAVSFLAKSRERSAVPLIIDLLVLSSSYQKDEYGRALDLLNPEWRSCPHARDSVKQLRAGFSRGMDEDSIALAGIFRVKDVVPSLEHIATDSSATPRRRLAALTALMRIDGSVHVSVLEQCIESPDEDIVESCLPAIERLPREGAVRLLLDIWRNDSDCRIRLQVLKSLQSLQSPVAVDLALTMLEQNPCEFAEVPLDVLASFPSSKTDAMVRDLFRATIKSAGKEAWELAGYIRYAAGAKSGVLNDDLLASYKSLPSEIRPSVIEVFVMTGDTRAIPFLQGDLKDSNSRLRAYAEWGLYRLSTLARQSVTCM